MTVRRKAHARNDLAPLGQRRVHAKLVVVAVQIVDVLSDDFALEILPRTIANAVARIDGRLPVGSLGAQIGTPGLSSRAMALSQLLTMLVGAVKAARARPRSCERPSSQRREVRRRLSVAAQTLERHAGACYAGSRPYLGPGLLGSPENRYNLPHFRVHPGNPGLGEHD